MQVMAWIPWLDILLAVIFVGLIVLGFWQGLLKELWLLIALYLGAILGSLYGDALGELIGQRVPAQAGRGGTVAANPVSSAWGFFIVFIVATLVLFGIIFALFGRIRLRASLLALDKAGGIILGVVTSLFLTTFFAFVLKTVIPFGPDGWAFAAVLKQQAQTSPLLWLFVSTRPVILATIQVWMPAGLPAWLQAL